MASLFNERKQGNLPCTSKVNPRRDDKEHCKVITVQDKAENDENSAGNLGNSDECWKSVEMTRKA